MIQKTLLSDSTQYTQFQYSSENKLTNINSYAGGGSAPIKTASYYYDGFGRRIGKNVNDTTAPSDPSKTFARSYVYDGSDIRSEYDGRGNLLAVYANSGIRTDDVLGVSIQQSGAPVLAQKAGVYYYLEDQVGSIIEVVDGSGNALQHYSYSTYGQVLGITGTALSTSRTFTGRELDSESGLYYYRARYMILRLDVSCRRIRSTREARILTLMPEITRSFS